jgi:16S rRNA (adenine1518-N6/adenine1519-N6)-dimethyltransferase
MKAKKSLGQNFFINENLGNYIINIVKESNSNTIVEIGPGMGFFTKKLQKEFKNLLLIEKDDNIINNLKLEFPNTKIIHSDFLNFNLKELPNTNISFFGSLPFNVSKPIIRKIIESNYFNKKAFFIIQKEVAKKYLYQPPYSILSLTTSIYAETSKIIDISPDSFRPKPNVTSSLISFSPNKKNLSNKKNLENLITLSFKQPRKNILNNLKGTKFKKGCTSFKTMRPSQLSLENYIEILKNSLF